MHDDLGGLRAGSKNRCGSRKMRQLVCQVTGTMGTCASIAILNAPFLNWAMRGLSRGMFWVDGHGFSTLQCSAGAGQSAVGFAVVTACTGMSWVRKNSPNNGHFNSSPLPMNRK